MSFLQIPNDIVIRQDRNSISRSKTMNLYTVIETISVKYLIKLIFPKWEPTIIFIDQTVMFLEILFFDLQERVVGSDYPGMRIGGD